MSISAVLSLISISFVFLVLFFKLDNTQKNLIERFYNNPINYMFLFMGMGLTYIILIVESIILNGAGATQLEGLFINMSTVMFWILVFLSFIALIRFVVFAIRMKELRRKEGVRYD